MYSWLFIWFEKQGKHLDLEIYLILLGECYLIQNRKIYCLSGIILPHNEHLLSCWDSVSSFYHFIPFFFTCCAFPELINKYRGTTLFPYLSKGYSGCRRCHVWRHWKQLSHQKPTHCLSIDRGLIYQANQANLGSIRFKSVWNWSK